jgi:hypothetical protein
VTLAVVLVAGSLSGASDTAVEIGARLAVISLLSLVAAIALGWSWLVPVSLVFLGATYATHLGVDDVPLDVKAPLLAAGLYLTAELAYWSLEERDDLRAEPGEGLRRVGVLAVLGIAALAAGGVVLAAADLTHVRGLATDLLGAAAAAAVLVVVVLAGRDRWQEGG